MKPKYWMAGWLTIVCLFLGMLGVWVYKVDPYMHYHRPDTTNYFYKLNNQRSQNDGIIKHFDYDALITGTSMTENFKTTDMDNIFGTNSIKVPFEGASYNEINDNIEKAIDCNPNLKCVVRGLDIGKFFEDKDKMRDDLGDYPLYLYDSNPLNDVQYIWNRDIIWNIIYQMTVDNNQEGFEPGITTFDDYSNWQYNNTFGIDSICPNGISEIKVGNPIHLTDELRETIDGNISQNVTSLAKANPQVIFYYFFTPYSAAWWKDHALSGTIYMQVEAEEYVIEKILECDNIKLFSFNNRTDITSDLNNYKDSPHYGQWINSLILKWMYDGQYQITKDNYKTYLEEELDTYLNMDYYALNEQEDYESDFYAAALLNKEFAGVEPIGLLEANTETPGTSIDVNNVDKYGYLVFWGKKLLDNGQLTVYVLGENGEKVAELCKNCDDIDDEWHQYVIDITKAKGNIRIVFNGEYIDNLGSEERDYVFRDIAIF